MPDLPPVEAGIRIVSKAMIEQGYTTPRAELIDRLGNIPAFDDPIEGSLMMDGTEQTLVLDEIVGNPLRYLEGYVDVSAMEAGDEIVLRIYAKIATDVNYKQYAVKEYRGVQDLPLAYMATKPVRYGLKITAQQIAGTYKTLAYQFFRKRVA